MVTRETEEFMESVEADGDTPKLALIILRRMRAEIEELQDKYESAAMGWDDCAHDLLHANERIAELESVCVLALPELELDARHAPQMQQIVDVMRAAVAKGRKLT